MAYFFIAGVSQGAWCTTALRYSGSTSYLDFRKLHSGLIVGAGGPEIAGEGNASVAGEIGEGERSGMKPPERKSGFDEKPLIG